MAESSMTESTMIVTQQALTSFASKDYMLSSQAKNVLLL